MNQLEEAIKYVLQYYPNLYFVGIEGIYSIRSGYLPHKVLIMIDSEGNIFTRENENLSHIVKQLSDSIKAKNERLTTI